MRKLLISLIAVSALFAMTAALASATRSRPLAHASVIKCDVGQPGGRYLPPCTAPTVAVRSIVACQKTGKILSFPVTLHASAGLTRGSVKFRGKTIKKKSYPSHPVTAHLVAKINTRGFKPGLFTLTASVTDTLGKHASKSAHFTICKPVPVFTG